MCKETLRFICGWLVREKDEHDEVMDTIERHEDQLRKNTARLKEIEIRLNIYRPIKRD